ncbi:F-box only protein 5-like [Limulus polyphemus]|uniref:F-box only protein 5-like n=1 Tax=Limulus polyphemus TaxID=6850 RepID=A0ABM1BPK9_LIMPO|nr:F-box only protein 5-like [Limulus polyphemus]
MNTSELQEDDEDLPKCAKPPDCAANNRSLSALPFESGTKEMEIISFEFQQPCSSSNKGNPISSPSITTSTPFASRINESGYFNGSNRTEKSPSSGNLVYLTPGEEFSRRCYYDHGDDSGISLTPDVSKSFRACQSLLCNSFPSPVPRYTEKTGKTQSGEQTAIQPLKNERDIVSLKCMWQKTTEIEQYSFHQDVKVYVPIGGAKIKEECVDFIHDLAKRNIHCVISHIFRFLSARELCSVACVSHAWNDACLKDPAANTRRNNWLQHFKEKLARKGKENVKGKSPISLVEPYVRKGPLSSIQNTAAFSPASNSVEVKSEDYFTLFQREAKKLNLGERLAKCPKCRSPSRVNIHQNRAFCTRPLCAFDFCPLCRFAFHDSNPCPTSNCSRISKKDIIGSKKSKNNLKRL